MRDDIDTAKRMFEREGRVRSVRVFVRQTEPEQNARHLEGVVHLSDERDRPAFADEYRTLAEALLERPVRHLKERMGVRRDPRLALTVHVQLEPHRLLHQLADVALT